MGVLDSIFGIFRAPVAPEPQRMLVEAAHGQRIPQANHAGWNGETYPGGWGPDDDNILSSILSMDYLTLRDRSEQLFETNLYARGLVRRLVTNEVHTGLSLEADPDSQILGRDPESLEGWTDQVEARFAAWASTPDVCDHDKRQDGTFGELTAIARREALVGGDVLVILRHDTETNLPTVQLIPGRQVVTPFPLPVGDATIVDGVELDAEGRHVAYHVRGEATLENLVPETRRIAAFGAKTRRRAAWLMYGTDKRLGQTRGAPLLAIMLQSLREIDQYRTSAQRKAALNAMLSMWVEKGEDKMSSLAVGRSAVKAGTSTAPNMENEARDFAHKGYLPGIVLDELQHGEKIHAHQGGTTDTTGFPEFEASIIAAVAWANEMPPEILRLAFDKNYAASQASLNEFKMYLTVSRGRIARSIYQPFYEAWLLASVRKGTITAEGLLEASLDRSKFETYAGWVRADWIGAVKPVMDMFKMAKAFEIMADRGWTTNARIARELTGTKFQTNARQLRRELDELPVRELQEGTSNDTILDDPTSSGE